MKILAIESSCDEFSMAVVENGSKCTTLETFSQINNHAIFGGVVPELASRMHVEQCGYILNKIKKTVDIATMDALAVTIGPGLSGSLMVGIQIAKMLAYLYKLPLIPMHHIVGHIFSVSLSKQIKFPALVLVVSGGHTEIIHCETAQKIEVIGRTQDDAVGEVYDKIAKKLDLPYPGGPMLDKKAKQGIWNYQFTKPKLEEEFAFSFSGYKSAVINHINKGLNSEQEKNNLIHSFQMSVCDELLRKFEKALSKYSVQTAILCGGVSANSEIRSQFLELQLKFPNVQFEIPNLEYCGDNAAMIGAAAYHFQPLKNKQQFLELDCFPNITITNFLSQFNDEVKV